MRVPHDLAKLEMEPEIGIIEPAADGHYCNQHQPHGHHYAKRKKTPEYRGRSGMAGVAANISPGIRHSSAFKLRGRLRSLGHSSHDSGGERYTSSSSLATAPAGVYVAESEPL